MFRMCLTGHGRTFGERRRRQFIFEPVTISSSQIVKLATDQTAQSRSDNGALVGRFGQTAGEKIDVTNVTVCALQCRNRRSGHYVTQLFESLDLG